MATDTTPPKTAPSPEGLLQRYWTGASDDARLTVISAIGLAILGAVVTIISSQSSHPPAQTHVNYTTQQPAARDTPLPARVDSTSEPVPVQRGIQTSMQTSVKVREVLPSPQSANAPAVPSAAMVAEQPLLNTQNTVTPLAILLIDNDVPVAALTEQLAEHFRGSGSLFTPAFFRSGVFERIVGGDITPLSALHVERQAAAVLLGTISATADTDTRDQSLSVVTISCNAKLYLAVNGFNYHHISVSGKGVDFNKQRAEREANEILFTNLTAELKKHL